jgi:hypothetical protein
MRRYLVLIKVKAAPARHLRIAHRGADRETCHAGDRAMINDLVVKLSEETDRDRAAEFAISIAEAFTNQSLI